MRTGRSGHVPERPGMFRWLWYAVTGRLIPRYHAWAFQDLTCRTWPVRHLARLLVLAVPIAALLIFLLPGPATVRVTAAVTGMVIGLLYSFVFLHESTDRRAVKLGYPSGAVDAARKHRQAPWNGGTAIPAQRDRSRT